jgi:hypothetical protein
MDLDNGFLGSGYWQFTWKWFHKDSESGFTMVLDLTGFGYWTGRSGQEMVFKGMDFSIFKGTLSLVFHGSG